MQGSQLIETIRTYDETYPRSYWDQMLIRYERWWEGQTDRPLIHIMRGEQPTTSAGAGIPAFQRFWNYYPHGTTVDQMIGALYHDLNQVQCLGDGFPHRIPQFGAGVLAAMLGAASRCVSGTVWFEPEIPRAIDQLTFDFDRQNPVFTMISSIYTRIGELSEHKNLQIGMTDIGGTADVLASFRPGSGLMMDFYDHEAEVIDRIWELHDLWLNVFTSYEKILSGHTPGYTCWAPILSSRPYYMLQCDLAYSIGPQMFERFILPELKETCRQLERPCYHLDGAGQLVHLDSLLSIEELKVIQWIPGEGSRPITQWPEVFRKIQAAGKKIQIFLDIDADPYQLDTIADQIGSAGEICAVSTVPFHDIKAAEDLVRRFS